MSITREGTFQTTGKWNYPLVLLCFGLSGFAALLYQTAWMRQFSIVFGTSELAVAVVLAAYMAGLGLGALWGGWLLERVRRPVLAYGALELGIALGALAVPPALRLAQSAQEVWIGGQPQLVSTSGWITPLFHGAAAFLVILVPTTFMGATLPLLTRHAVHRESQIGSRTGMLYAINTAGAVLGTLAAAFLLLPALGLGSTVHVGVATNGLVFLLAAWIAQNSQLDVSAEGERREPLPGKRSPLILLLVALSGTLSFTYEVLWTRLFGQALGGSLYSFATMLATFLVGITLGSALGALFARTRRAATLGFVLSQLGIGVFSALIWSQLDDLTSTFLAKEEANPGQVWGSAQVVARVLLPQTLCIGAIFPFALRILTDTPRDAGRASARVYAWNTFGAIAGALLSGFLVIPAIGFVHTVHGAVWISLLLAVGTAWLLGNSRALGAVTTLVAVLIGLAFSPALPERLLRYSPAGGVAEGEILHFEVGRSATVMALEQEDSFKVRANGLPEAGVNLRGAIPFGGLATKYMALLPILARPGAESMMVIGFGCGVTLESIPPSIQSIDVVELEPAILNANSSFAHRRAVDPLADPRVRVTLNDARGAMMLTDQRWDIIVSQASHPWTAGASHLYTREFLDLARSRLKNGGVFMQWMSTGFLDEELFRTLGATMLTSFEHVRLYRPSTGILVFLGSDQVLEPERALLRTGQPLAEDPLWWRKVGMGSVQDLLACLALEQAGLEELCGEAPPCTDDENLLAMKARHFQDDEQLTRLEELLSDGDPLLQTNGSLRRDLAEILDVPYLARRLASAGNSARARAFVESWPPGSAVAARAAGNASTTPSLAEWGTGQRHFQEAFRLDPENQEGRFLLIRDDLPRIARGHSGTEHLQAIAEQLKGPPLLIYRNWQALASGRWQEVQATDQELAAIPTNAPWSSHGARQRAEWRLHRLGDGEQGTLAEEAIAIVDAVLVLELNPHLVLLRADLSKAAGLPSHFVESLDVLGKFLGPWSASLPPAVVQELRDALPRLAQHLQELRGDSNLSALRLERVLDRLPR